MDAWKAANPDRVKVHQKRYEAQRPRRALGRHGLTEERFDEILRLQGGGCAICGEPQETYHIDHDHGCCPGTHSCGRCIRGLLCAQDNLMLGLVKDDTERLRTAAAYLEGKRAASSAPRL